MLDRSKIGLTLPPLFYEVEKGQLHFFSKVVGETDPIFFDEEAAKAAGYRSIVAPPTFGFSCLRGSADDMPFVSALGLGDEEIGRMLHGEQGFRYHGPICAGDRIKIEESIVDVFEKKARALQFIITRTRLSNQFGDLVLEMSASMIVQMGPRQ